MDIPLVNLQRQYQSVKKDIDAAIKTVCEKSDFILGDEVETFEKEFAKYIGVKYCVGVASGTDAIKLMAMAAGIGPGDEVIVQANTFISSVLPIIELGAIPVFVDCDKTGAMDISNIHITKKTRAILPVHLYGRAFAKAPAGKHILILEDACQAHGTPHVGHVGAMAAFSFYPGKNLGAYGDAGAVTTNNKKYADTIRILRNIGQKKKYDHVRLGLNSRLDTIQAAILSVKLKHLDAWNKKRQQIALGYLSALGNIGDLILPPNTPTNWHLFVVQTAKRNALMKYLDSKGIHCLIHYPVPLHLTPALKFLGYKKGDFPVAENRAKTILTLPLYAELNEKEIEYIVTTIKKFYET